MSFFKGRRVVVTGLGVVACNGIGLDAFWSANRNGRSGISVIDHFDTELLSAKVGGVVRGFEPTEFMASEFAKRVDRFVHFGVATAKMALTQSGLDLDRVNRDRIGVIIGSGLGGLLFHEEQIASAFDRGAHRINPLSVPRISPNAVSGHVGITFGLRGPNMVISTACASGAHAIGEAYRKIRYGEIDQCFTGGVEAPISLFGFGAYGALRVLSKRNDDPTKASRPFDRDRDGFVMSEGGAMLILEERESALARGATVLAEILGYASNSGAHHMVMPEPEGADATLVIRAALEDAGLDTVDYINAHATSTKANDVAETKAIKSVFGERARRIPVSSTKSMIGHTLGAAGAIEAVVCVQALREQFIPPTINLENADPECDLDYVPNVGRSAKLRTVLSNSFGFGNCNVALIFGQ
ncbi:MAG TPA: beta-ketoacyl-ACP synthase II [Opitutaceae bacterium]